MVSEHADPAAALGGADAGGQNVHVAALASGLAAQGHVVTVYTRMTSARQRPATSFGRGVTVRRLKAGPAAPLPKDELVPFMPEFGDRLRREWQRMPPDVVHAHFWMSGLAALRGAAGICTPVVQTFHALGVVKARHQGHKDTSPPGRTGAERRIALACDQVIATCADEAGELRGMGVPRSQISIVPCGVDTDLFCPAPARRRRAGRPRLLALGRLVERKGIDTVIAALPALPGVELLVAGGPGRADLPTDPEYQRLCRAAAAHQVADRVTFTGGVARGQVPALIRSADVVVCTPWYEPFGIVPLEAMSCGVPVIASAVGGLTDTVVPDSTGILVPPKDPAALAAAARTLLGDPGLRAAFGHAGRRRVMRWYDWSRVAEQTEAVYSRLIGLARPAQPAAREAAAASSR